MPECLAGIKEYATIVLTLVSTVGVLAMGWLNLQTARQQARTAEQQAKIARTKLRLELFDRRIEVYDRVRGVAKKVLNGSYFREEIENEYREAMKDVSWLFGEQIRLFLVRDIQSCLQSHYEEQKLHLAAEKSGTDDRVEARQRFQKVRSELNELYSKMPKTFSPFLRLSLRKI